MCAKFPARGSVGRLIPVVVDGEAEGEHTRQRPFPRCNAVVELSATSHDRRTQSTEGTAFRAPLADWFARRSSCLPMT